MSKRIGFILCLLLSLLLVPGVVSYGQEGIVIESGASFVATGAATIEITDGSFQNDGTYTKDTETVTFSGTTAGTISGSGTTDFYNLTNTNSGGITISSGTAVTVSNDFSNTGTFSINSDATSNGSFIVTGNSTGSVTYNRYMTGGTTGSWIWHLVSSPVAGQTISSFAGDFGTTVATSGTDKYGLAPYDNSTNTWNYYTTAAGDNDVASAGNFGSGLGYEIARDGDGTMAFTGTIATVPVSPAITIDLNGWNLVGNPFPSAINANSNADGTNNFYSVNSANLDNSYGALYFWDAAGSSYITVNQSSDATYVTPGQAFFVYSASASTTVSFTEAMQTHQTTGALLKKAKLAIPIIRLFAESSGGNSSTNIKYFENTTTGLDPGYDAGRFSAFDNSFAVYTHLVNDSESKEDFDIQCLPYGEFDHVIPVGLNAPQNSEIVFHVETENLPPDVPVYLEDKTTGEFTALHETGTSYTITLSEQMAGTGRFFLHTTQSATGLTQPLDGRHEYTIIPRPNQNFILIGGHKTGASAQLVLFDISGRQILNTPIHTESYDVDMTGLKSGIYIVSIQSSRQQFSKKISWIKPH